MLKKIGAVLSVVATVQAFGMMQATADSKIAVCYSCPEQWADWGTQLKTIKEETGVEIPVDNKNSGQALSQIIAEKANPVADFGYLGITFAIKGTQTGVLQTYKPPHFDEISDDMKDPDGHWFVIHRGTIGFFINKDALGDKPVPRSWADLLKPEYSGLVGYYDPTSAFVGYVSGMSVNLALGGSLDDFKPAMDFYNKLKSNSPIVVNQTSYARVVSGEIPILVDTDFNAYRAKYKDNANIEFVIPEEGSLPLPYTASFVKDAPHPEAAKEALAFLLSDKGQAIWANAFLRPIRTSAMPPEAAEKFLPESDYARVKSVDWADVAEAQQGFADAYLKEVR